MLTMLKLWAWFLEFGTTIRKIAKQVAAARGDKLPTKSDDKPL